MASPHLGTVYAEFVRDPERQFPALVEGLAKAEQWAESEWLALYGEGKGRALVTQPFSRLLGRRLWIGPDLPIDAAAGDIWFDVVEVMPMILLPSEPLGWREEAPLITYRPLKSWLACRPVADWQYAGYKVLTGEPPEDPRNDAWRAGVTRAEASRYARYVGKTLSSNSEWQAAAEFVSTATLDDLWADQSGEWSDERSDYDDDLAFIVRRGTFYVDLDDALDAHDLENAPDPRGWTVFPRDERLPGIGFRTSVNMQFGLMTRPPDT
jgi:hypothetical protein